MFCHRGRYLIPGMALLAWAIALNGPAWAQRRDRDGGSRDGGARAGARVRGGGEVRGGGTVRGTVPGAGVQRGGQVQGQVQGGVRGGTSTQGTIRGETRQRARTGIVEQPATRDRGTRSDIMSGGTIRERSATRSQTDATVRSDRIRRHDRDDFDDDHHHRHRGDRFAFGFGYGPFWGSYGPWYGFYGPWYSPWGFYSPWYGGFDGFYGYGPMYGGYAYDEPAYVDQGSAYFNADRARRVPETTAQGTEFMRQAEAAFRAGNYEDAVRLANHAAIEMPRNGRLFLFLSQAFFAIGNFGAAAGAAHQAMSILEPDDWGVVVREFRNYYGNGNDYTDQLRRLEKFVSDNPDAAFGRFLLGYHYGFLGYPNEARRQLEQAVAMEDRDELSGRLLERFGGQAPPPRAREDTRRRPEAPRMMRDDRQAGRYSDEPRGDRVTEEPAREREDARPEDETEPVRERAGSRPERDAEPAPEDARPTRDAEPEAARPARDAEPERNSELPPPE